MFMSFFKSDEDEKDSLETLLKQLDLRYAQLAIEMERMKALTQKIDKLETNLKTINEMISASGITLQRRTIAGKTKDAIRLILQKHSEVTPYQLSKLIKLSRTRCNEYLKQMEEEGLAVSTTISRKKFYSLRQ